MPSLLHKLQTGLRVSLLLLLAFPPAVPAASTSNLEREKNWAEQIGDFLVAGEAIRLEASGVRFLALYTKPRETVVQGRTDNGAEGRNTATRGIILLHGRGVHPAWGFIDTLRVDLAEAGWHTLSLQLPILDQDVKFAEYGKTFPEALQRIDAGVRYLREKGVKQIVLVGHSSGANTAVTYAAEHPKASLVGLTVIGLTTEPAGNRYMQSAPQLEKLKLPILDIFGSEDLPVVLDTASARAAAAKKAGNSGYTQVRVKGANHFFTDRYDSLRTRLGEWLTTLPAK